MGKLKCWIRARRGLGVSAGLSGGQAKVADARWARLKGVCGAERWSQSGSAQRISATLACPQCGPAD